MDAESLVDFLEDENNFIIRKNSNLLNQCRLCNGEYDRFKKTEADVKMHRLRAMDLFAGISLYID
jgi:hypothetical protein